MIRDFKQEDLQEYIMMSKAMYDSPAVLHPVSEETLTHTFKVCLEEGPYCRGVMIEVEGKIAGYGLLSFTYSNEVGGLVVLCEEIYIKEEYRGQGLGNTFFEWLFNEYKDTAKRYRLEVTESNAGARKLYEKLGFENLDYKQMIKDI